nr:MAG: hypothetical protein [Lake Baikal virophage 14]
MTTKEQIWKKVYDLDFNKLESDFKKLREIGCNANDKGLSRVGNEVVNYFTSLERLDTIGNKGISFFDFYENRLDYSRRKYIKNILKYYNTNNRTTSIKQWKRIFDLYFGSIAIFRPIVAMGVYCYFSPKCVLDPTMGWGGRLVGACALDVPKYIGIDLNRNLMKPYDEMSKFLSKHSSTKIELFFGDCITFDYSKIEYDMVFTSPPYYNVEQYNFQEKKTKEEWNETFYKPFVRETFKHLKKGGHYCLNVPEEIYTIVTEILGDADFLIPFPKSQRGDPNTEKKYKEFIYTWKK